VVVAYQKRGVPAGVPLSFYPAGRESLTCRVRLITRKGVEVNRSRGSKEDKQDRYADVMWMENLELNRLLGGKAMTETMWRCDQVRAGQLYNRMMFDTKAEAEEFMQRMQQMEPDQMFSIEAIEAKQVWN
jgi:hypothetical protein